jgi:hypothetical protein
MFNLYDIYFFLFLSLYYYKITQTPQTKAFICTIATTLSSVTIFNYYPILLSNPMYSEGIMIQSTNAFMRQYLIIDLYNVLFIYKKLRKDMVIHHIMCSTPFYTNNNITSAYATFAELLSSYPLFIKNKKIISLLRILTIFPIRFLLFIHVMYLSYHPAYNGFYIASNWSFYTCILALLLDMYWIKQMVTDYSKLYLTEKSNFENENENYTDQKEK